MKKNFLATMVGLISAAMGSAFSNSHRAPGIVKGRARTRDVAITYRMIAGFPGDVNRTHPAGIEPCLIDVNSPPTLYGAAVVCDATTNGVRPVTTGDTAAYGVTVRPFPLQASAGSSYGAVGIGAATPPTSGVIDILRSGYIMATLNGTVPSTKGGTVYVRVASASAGKPIGGFEAAADGGNTITLPAQTTFNGPADATGNVEIAFNV